MQTLKTGSITLMLSFRASVKEEIDKAIIASLVFFLFFFQFDLSCCKIKLTRVFLATTRNRSPLQSAKTR